MANEIQRFEIAQRKAKAYSLSGFVPEHFRNNIPNCLVAVEMANRLQMNPFMIIQNMYIVYGRPAFSSTFVIACINACGRFEPIQFEYSGEGDNRQCVAFAREKTSGNILRSTPVSIGMAKAEGWYSKKGSKWLTMPDLMLQYRAAAFFGRAYAPDYLMGLQTREEVGDIGRTSAYSAVAVNESTNSNVIDMAKEQTDDLESLVEQQA
ncbi:recombinase family protein [Caedibacter taeniospiralis]|uniref:hypothetical protein n=1 Tax=Caedibacter taeniospiralis TaxID=28907 RepID=UPI000C27887D|nr:hypothetical protein [Caedibacter taeniospiralis]